MIFYLFVLTKSEEILHQLRIDWCFYYLLLTTTPLASSFFTTSFQEVTETLAPSSLRKHAGVHRVCLNSLEVPVQWHSYMTRAGLT